MAATDHHSQAKYGTGLVVGLLVGMAVTCFLTSIPAYLFSQHLFRKQSAGWNLVPVVVGAIDAPAGTVVTFDIISQRSIPEGAVSPGMVKPDSASYVVNQVTAARWTAGDVLLWSHFEAPTIEPACLEAALEGLKPLASTPDGLKVRDALLKANPLRK